MTDIVDELRRLYAEATGDDPRPWERMEKHDRVLGHPIYHGDPENEGVGVAFTLRAADLIVAMHEALPALLDAVEALRWYADEDNYDPESGAPGQWWNVSAAPCDPDEWDFEVDCGSIARTALAALKRSDEG